MSKEVSKRIVKTVSFAANEYERGLLDHATDPARGTFSQYVKRLIDRDIAGAVAPVQAVTPVVVRPAKSEKDRNEAHNLVL